MLVKANRNKGARRKAAPQPDGDGRVVPYRPSSPLSPLIDLPPSERKVVAEVRGELTITTYVDLPADAPVEEPEQFPLSLPEGPLELPLSPSARVIEPRPA